MGGAVRWIGYDYRMHGERYSFSIISIVRRDRYCPYPDGRMSIFIDGLFYSIILLLRQSMSKTKNSRARGIKVSLDQRGPLLSLAERAKS